MCATPADVAAGLKRHAKLWTVMGWSTEFFRGGRHRVLGFESMQAFVDGFMTGYFGMNFQWLVNSTQTFGTWLLLGALLPVVAVIVSVWLLQLKGFNIGRKVEHRFHLRAARTTGSPPTESNSQDA